MPDHMFPAWFFNYDDLPAPPNYLTESLGILFSIDCEK